MNKTKLVTALMYLLIVTPIWFYLLYKILVAVNASELMWFLYWIYLPMVIVTGVVTKLVSDED